MSYGAAVRITKENRRALRILNGVVLAKSVLKKPCYFVFPYSSNKACEVLNEREFREKYKFMNNENSFFLVDVKKV